MIKRYRQHQQAIHNGQILPVGVLSAPDEAPSGTGWIGFQSIQDNGGYVIVYREWTAQEQEMLKLWGLANRQVHFEHIMGAGQDFAATIEGGGRVTFHLPERFSFALYRYRVL
jgi:hypothetical protein